MTITADTGNTTTAVLTSTGLVGAGIRELGSVDQDGEKIEDSLISSTVRKTYIPGDLYEPGSVEVTLEPDPTIACGDCRVQTAQGSVESRMSDHLNEINQTLRRKE